MVDRIRILLQVRQLSTTQFADTIGVARPVISHILSGRNKPSLEVVQRILAAFPDLSMAWLLNGTAPMLTGTTAEAPPLPPPAAATTPLPRPAAFLRRAAPAMTLPTNQAIATPEHIGGRPSVHQIFDKQLVTPAAGPQAPTETMPRVSVASSSELDTAPGATQPVASTEPAATASPATPLPAALTSELAMPPAPMEPAAAAMFGQSGKAIRRIVIFYRDGSFADYQPE